MELELDLGLSISSRFPTKNGCDIGRDHDNNVKSAAGRNMEFKNLMKIGKKRRCSNEFEDDDDHFVEETSSHQKTLSLLVWNGRRPNPGDDEDDEEEEEVERRRKGFYISPPQELEEDDEIVGWPPIGSWRKKLISGGGGGTSPVHMRRNNGDENQIHHGAPENSANVGGNMFRNSIFVKVKMEGVVIGRKIDLMQINSYQGLTNTLFNMFAKHNSGDDDHASYVLSYLDKQGNWLLVGDVPWRTFIESVQRMEILKSSG